MQKTIIVERRKSGCRCKTETLKVTVKERGTFVPHLHGDDENVSDKPSGVYENTEAKQVFRNFR